MVRPDKNKYRISQPYKGKAHGGIDIAPPAGTKPSLYSFDNGQVVQVSSDPISGKYVVIRSDKKYDGKQLYSFTGHMDSTSVKVGQKVKEGQVIGKFGMTGKATGIHTHNEIWDTLWVRYEYDPQKVYDKYKENDMYKGKSAKYWYDQAQKYKKDWQGRKEQSLKRKSIIDRIKKALGK